MEFSAITAVAPHGFLPPEARRAVVCHFHNTHQEQEEEEDSDNHVFSCCWTATCLGGLALFTKAVKILHGDAGRSGWGENLPFPPPLLPSKSSSSRQVTQQLEGEKG